MGIFSNKPVVTQKEFHKNVRQELYQGGVPERKIDKIQTILQGYFDHDTGESVPGMHKEEIAEAVKNIRDNKHSLELSDNQVSLLESSLKKHL